MNKLIYLVSAPNHAGVFCKFRKIIAKNQMKSHFLAFDFLHGEKKIVISFEKKGKSSVKLNFA